MRRCTESASLEGTGRCGCNIHVHICCVCEEYPSTSDACNLAPLSHSPARHLGYISNSYSVGHPGDAVLNL